MLEIIEKKLHYIVCYTLIYYISYWVKNNIDEKVFYLLLLSNLLIITGLLYLRFDKKRKDQYYKYYSDIELLVREFKPYIISVMILGTQIFFSILIIPFEGLNNKKAGTCKFRLFLFF